MFLLDHKTLKYYLLFIFFSSLYLFYAKFMYPTDWTISEWLINYEAGFIRRGFSGQLIFIFYEVLEINIRVITFSIIFSLLGVFYWIFYNFLSGIKLNIFLIFLIYSPFFLIYPVAEPEVIGRKEYLFFIIYIIYLNLLINQSKKVFIYLFFSLPIMNLIWDGIIFYLFFFILSFLFKKNFKIKDLYLLGFSLIPYLISLYFVISSSSLANDFNIICYSFGESCWGALSVMGEKNPLIYILDYMKENVRVQYIIRYSILFLVAFMPFVLVFKCQNNFKIFNFSIVYFYILVLLPIILFHFIANDWGRWINIGYVLSLLNYLYLIKINVIGEKNKVIIFFEEMYLNKPKMVYLIFFIYCMTWNMKATMSNDLGSLPHYRAISKIIKYLSNQIEFYSF